MLYAAAADDYGISAGISADLGEYPPCREPQTVLTGLRQSFLKSGTPLIACRGVVFTGTAPGSCPAGHERSAPPAG
jgi:hypothetical protein